MLTALLSLFLFLTPLAHADTSTSTLQTQINANSAQILQLQQEIAQLQTQLAATTKQKQTLQNAIAVLNLNIQKITTSITLTNAQIAQTDLQIQNLTGSISTTTVAIGSTQEEIGNSLRDLDELDAEPLVLALLGNATLSSFFDQSNELGSLRDDLESKVNDLSDLKDTLTTNKTTAVGKRTQLAALQTQLNQQKESLAATRVAKNDLLTQTKNQEATYQQLLTAAQAELAGFSAFTQNAGGSKLLTNQTSCDDWGCYYNQRDVAWGNLPLNGTQYRLASDGCLVASMAMVLTHYGYRDVTPVTINSNSANFAAYYPAYLLFTTYVDGITATRVTALIDATLATGNPVIVGLHAYGGTHFVVLVSGQRGSYIMRDPYVANGKDIAFSDHYSLGSIYAVNKVLINK